MAGLILMISDLRIAEQLLKHRKKNLFQVFFDLMIDNEDSQSKDYDDDKEMELGMFF